jgi:hypothetical protein
MLNLTAGDLTIEVAGEEPARMDVHWRGKSTDRDPCRLLRPFFGRVLEEAATRQAAVEMHFERLDHLNSSTITAIVQMIQDARARAVKLVMVYDGKLRWQKVSFDALKVLSGKDGLFELRAN